jgi:hypothetical protein
MHSLHSWHHVHLAWHLLLLLLLVIPHIVWVIVSSSASSSYLSTSIIFVTPVSGRIPIVAHILIIP